jgi:hypothetical protein
VPDGQIEKDGDVICNTEIPTHSLLSCADSLPDLISNFFPICKILLLVATFVAMGWMIRVLGFDSQQGWEFFSSPLCPEQL